MVAKNIKNFFNCIVNYLFVLRARVCVCERALKIYNPTLFYLIGVNHTISAEQKLKLVLLVQRVAAANVWSNA